MYVFNDQGHKGGKGHKGGTGHQGGTGTKALLVLAAICVTLAAWPAHGQLRPNPAVLAQAPPELLEQLRADPFTTYDPEGSVWAAAGRSGPDPIGASCVPVRLSN